MFLHFFTVIIKDDVSDKRFTVEAKNAFHAVELAKTEYSKEPCVSFDCVWKIESIQH